jgi:solute:Na+ symporter, SSS family
LLITFIVLYLAATILIGIWASSRVKTAGDFMLAGRSLPLFLSAAALFATWFGSETVFGASSEFLNGGLYAVIEDPFGAALCLLLFGLFFARKLYNMNLLTLGDFFRVRFGKKAELVACIFLAPPYVGYIAAQLVAMGLILNVVTGVEVWQGVLISAFVVTIYTYIGGMWAVSITDFIQGIIIIVGLVVLCVSLAIQAGGVTTVLQSVPKGTFEFLPPLEFKPILGYIAAWSVLGLGSVPSQDVFQRAMSSKSPNVAVYACYLGAALYLVFAMLPLFISLCARHLFPDQLGGDSQLILPRMVLNHTSLAVQILFFGSLLSAIMSTTSSAILAPAAIVSENLIKPLLQGRLSDSRLLVLTRASVLTFSAMGCLMATLRSNIYELVGESSVLSLVSLFVPLTLGLYWKKANSAGAIAAMVLGMIGWIIFKFWDIGIPSLIPATLMSLSGMLAGAFFRPANALTSPAHEPLQ